MRLPRMASSNSARSAGAVSPARASPDSCPGVCPPPLEGPPKCERHSLTGCRERTVCRMRMQRTVQERAHRIRRSLDHSELRFRSHGLQKRPHARTTRRVDLKVDNPPRIIRSQLQKGVPLRPGSLRRDTPSEPHAGPTPTRTQPPRDPRCRADGQCVLLARPLHLPT